VDLQLGSRQKLRHAKVFVDGRQEGERRKEGKRNSLEYSKVLRAVIQNGLATSIGLHGTTYTDTAIGGVETKNCVGDGRVELEPRRSWHSHQATTIAIAVEARQPRSRLRSRQEGIRMRASGGLLVGPCDAGHAAGAQSDVETYMPRPHQEAGAGAPSYIGRENEYVKICTRFPPGRRAVQAELFVCAVACSGFLGRKYWVKKTQEPGPKRPKNPD
jgi:hypothetical protein